VSGWRADDERITRLPNWPQPTCVGLNFLPAPTEKLKILHYNKRTLKWCHLFKLLWTKFPIVSVPFPFKKVWKTKDPEELGMEQKADINAGSSSKVKETPNFDMYMLRQITENVDSTIEFLKSRRCLRRTAPTCIECSKKMTSIRFRCPCYETRFRPSSFRANFIQVETNNRRTIIENLIGFVGVTMLLEAKLII
jgi:hypothetical protein